MVKKIGILAGIGAALVAVLVLAGSAFAQDGGVSISDGSAATDGSGDVTLDVSDVGDPGLGAWTIDISFDNDLLTASDCTAEQGGVCNPEFEDTMVRITGASAGGLEGDTNLGSITFDCNGEGESDLTISISVFADATIGDPQDLDPTVSNGTFTCSDDVDDGDDAGDDDGDDDVTDLGDTGTGGFTSGGSSSVSWLVALFAVIGLAVLATGYGVARMRA